MPRHLFAIMKRVMATNLTPEHVHFHAGAIGRAYACHDPRCTSPQLAPDDLRDS
jgi:hypothetical protein